MATQTWRQEPLKLQYLKLMWFLLLHRVQLVSQETLFSIKHSAPRPDCCLRHYHTLIAGSDSIPTPLESKHAANSSSIPSTGTSVKNDETPSFCGHQSFPSITDIGLVKEYFSSRIPFNIPHSSPISNANSERSGAVLSSSQMSKNNIGRTDYRNGNNIIVQSLSSSMADGMILPQATRTSDKTDPIARRILHYSVVPDMQWKRGNSFPSQNETIFHLIFYILHLTNLL